jgi:phosphoribosyl-AMP cyclohydrolase
MGLNYDSRGLIPAVIQDAKTKDVLMLGYINAASLKLTLSSGDVWFFSRSRQELWHKGSTSGNYLKVKEVRQDCENNSLLILVDPTGPACHTGNRTCFFTKLKVEEE